jgi:hypothetical protein
LVFAYTNVSRGLVQVLRVGVALALPRVADLQDESSPLLVNFRNLVILVAVAANPDEIPSDPR